MRALVLLPLLLPLAFEPSQGRGGQRGGAPQERGGQRGDPAPRPTQRPTPPPAQGPGAGRGVQREAARPPAPQPTPDMEQADLYFRVADYDGDGWISWREAQSSLRVDRHRFEQIDANRDGLIDREEFRASFRRTVERLGAFPPPIPRPGTGGEQLLAGAETERKILLWPETPAASVAELFGEVEERESLGSLLHLPPLIPGPIESFLRLDVDRDGRITDADLDRLQRPVQLSVRRNTVLASLDTNGDGVIDREEFYAAMRGKRVPDF